jgi:ribosomal protein L7/L12
MSQLNVLEMVQFTKEMGKIMGVSYEDLMRGPAVASGPAPAAAAAAPAPEAKEEKKEEKVAPAKTTVTIKLTKVDEGNKYKVLKEIRALKPGMNLAEVLGIFLNISNIFLLV